MTNEAGQKQTRRRPVTAAAIGSTLIALSAVSAAAARSEIGAGDFYAMADRYCIRPDGDHPLTWALAESDGWVVLDPSQFEGLSLPGARQLRGYETVRDGVRLRILTANNRFRGWNAGITYFNLCWVSAEPFDRQELDEEIRSQLAIPGFRQEGARVYAWVPLPNGGRRIVGSREFQRRFHAIAREDGMRMLLSNDRQGMVAATYMKATEDCEGWCY
ncbi:hypothetical protein [Brevundimonas sp. AAP58]|uniref:hypothetical protein n=1 Tax=Brevundimonas sp. AAP58 TaxID=1523422 RepID=UPI000AF960B2|nr:hypothetical protein [Brevundimonas sp. AAP58]